MNIFPELELTVTEQNIIKDKLGDPTVKKYLNQLSYSVGKGIVVAGQPDNESNELYLRKIAIERGKLIVIDMLLSIQQDKKE